MKQLTKTALQQFNERLAQLTIEATHTPFEGETYYGCTDKNKQFIILRNVHNQEMNEIRYHKTYNEFVTSDNFIEVITAFFVERNLSVKPLFDWYASADHDDWEPFALMDIYVNTFEGEEHLEFSDLYEEVPDTRTITARQQWERDSAQAVATQVTESGYTYRIVNNPDHLDFYICTPEGGFCRRRFPSLDQLRRNNEFVINYIGHVKSTHPEDLDAAIYWLAQGKYTMSDVSLMDIYDIAGCIECLDYEDITVNQSEQNHLRDEYNTFRSKLIHHVETLLEQGLVINKEVLCARESITLTDGSCWCTEQFQDIYAMKDDKLQWILCYCCGVLTLDTESVYIRQISTDTLFHIIDSLQ